MKYRHNCITSWIGDGQSPETAYRPAITANFPTGAYGEPQLGDPICHVEFETDDPVEAQAIDDSPDTEVLHSEEDDNGTITPRKDKNTITTAAERQKVVNFLTNRGVTPQQLQWLKDRFEERYGPWNEAKRWQIAEAIRLAVKKRFRT